MDDTQPLFITFKCIAGDKAGSFQPGHGTTLLQPQSVEQCDARGRRGQGAAEGPQPQLPLAPCHVLQGCSQPREVAASLRARTKLWFEQTQVHRLGAAGNLPAWFHGFISRRDTEQMLQGEPLGCFLVRFSESTVGFVLSYRGRERCRHFVLDQLPNGHYVILGEHSAHPQLAELLQHYAHIPIPPYGELLTVPRGRDKACGVMRTPDSSSTSRKAPANPPANSTMAKRVPGDGQAAESGPEEASNIPLPLPAKFSSSAATQGPRSRNSSEGAEANSPSTQTHLEINPVEMLDAKYQQLMRFHTYAEPHEGTAPPVEPIPFYAMGLGSSPSAEANIYAEVATVQQEPPRWGARGPGSLLAPTTFLHRRLSHSLSNQGFHRRQLPATPIAGTTQRAAPRPALEIPPAPMNSALEFDDPAYSPRMSSTKQAAAPENIYEQVSRGHP
ncbi:SH2 domain-containing protein 2A [Centrocercus urophasianus]|uniref:SH2 domain-containing protein 2A n=1 Tax=Centrocercus urophasianus TaxID=9002 RepID=UPI001C651CC1|nr:SH2 domain-containing protein 2A [Centrocercus urophasianus]